MECTARYNKTNSPGLRARSREFLHQGLQPFSRNRLVSWKQYRIMTFVRAFMPPYPLIYFLSQRMSNQPTGLQQTNTSTILLENPAIKFRPETIRQEQLHLLSEDVGEYLKRRHEGYDSENLKHWQESGLGYYSESGY